MRLRCLSARTGASALLFAASSGLLVLGALGSADCAAVVVAHERAVSAADAAVHDAVTELAVHPDARVALSLLLQSGATTCDVAPGAAPAPDECDGPVAAVRAAVNAHSAMLMTLRLGPDRRDQGPGATAGGVVARVVVAVRVRLVGPGPVCREPPPPGGDLCWAVAAAAAQGT